MSTPSEARIPVAVLGATGAVGQTFVRLLQHHPHFRLAEVAASERSAGQRYDAATKWREGTLGAAAASLEVVPCDPEAVRSRIVFSALDASVAGGVEEAFARSGAVVLSNARNHRMADDVPLLIPEVNPGHLSLIEAQREGRGWKGAIVTNPNCSTTVAVMALAPLAAAFGVKTVFASTMQAVSGAGYPGVPSLDILGNVVPWIGGEEEKIETEARKLLGSFADGHVTWADMAVSAHANRVPVEHGHTVCLSIGLEQRATVDEVLEVLGAWTGADVCAGLPSAPARALIVTRDADRPQPRRDVDTGAGMTVTVGRVRSDPIFDVRLVALGHNTVRGAAGGSLLNAEVMGRLGMLPSVEANAW
jgi:aspartate-semialdehyde dehydrogenase